MTFYQDQKRRQNWIYIPAALIMPEDLGGAFVFVESNCDIGWNDPILAPRCFWSEMRPFLKDSCVGQRSCVYCTSRQFVLSCLPALLL